VAKSLFKAALSDLSLSIGKSSLLFGKATV